MDPVTEPASELKAPKHARWPLLVGFVILLAGGGFVAYRVLREPRVPSEALVVDAGAALVPDAGAGASVEEGDGLLQRLGASWSTSPLFLRWLEQLGLRQLVAAAQLVADGESPRPVVPFLHVDGPFAVREEAVPGPKPRKKRGRRPAPPAEVRLFIAPQSYARYDAVTAAVTSVDMAAVGAAWAELRPFVDAAYAEVGRPGTHFDDTLTVALRRLLTVTFPEGEVELVPKGAMYAFKDPSLEATSRAEKHLVRMGPKNGRAVQAALRDFASAAHLDIGP